MRRKLMCYGPFCHPKRIKHDREKLNKHGGKNYCEKCWAYVSRQREDRRALYHYMEDKAKISFPTPMMRRDIKKYLKEYNYTYRGIHTALKYADKFSLNFDFNNSYFLHYIPFIYEKAQRWRYRRDEHSNMLLNTTEVDNQTEHVKVKHKVFEPKKTLPHYDMSKF